LTNFFINDAVPEERKYGIESGFAWKEKANATIVYTDRGISKRISLLKI